MELATSKEFAQAIRSLGLDNSDAELEPTTGATVWRFPDTQRIAGMIEQDHNGRFHYLVEELLS